MTVGVGRQHAGITGQVENCQTVVFMAYVTAHAHALFDFRLYLPRDWCASHERRERAQIPDGVQFKTKTELGTAMITGAITAGAWFAWAAGDEVYGRASKLRAACERAGKGYVLAVPSNFMVTLPSRRKAAAAALARLIPARYWERRSCGRGCKGHRDYDWAWAATASPRHWLLIRRSLSDPSDLAFFYCHAPAGRPAFPARADHGRREEMASRRMSSTGKRPRRPGQPSGPALAFLPPAHRAVNVRARAARGRRRPASSLSITPSSGRRGHPRGRSRPARRLGRHRDAASQPRPETPGPDRHGQGQRPRSPPSPAPGHRSDDRRRTCLRLHLVDMAPRAPGPRTLSPLPGPAPGRTYLTMIKSQSRTVVPGARYQRAAGPITV